jgi:hypothetical protein
MHSVVLATNESIFKTRQDFVTLLLAKCGVSYEASNFDNMLPGQSHRTSRGGGGGGGTY